jgi:phage tail sheath gpL-like
MSGILFNYIPGSGLTAPIFSFEVNSGGQYQDIDRLILLGHGSAAGLLPVNTPYVVSNQNDCDVQAGAGSMLREMYRMAVANAPATPIWIVNVAAAGVVPVWTITIGTLPGVGVGLFEICGETFQITIGSSDTPTTIAAAIAAAINGYYNQLTNAMLPLTATSSTNVVTLTALHAGAIMNSIDIYTNPAIPTNLFGSQAVFAVKLATPGSGYPVVANALAALGDDPADFVVAPWSDATSLAAYTTWASDVSGRWAWNRQSYGHSWTAMQATFSALTTAGLTMNDRHTSIIGDIAGVAASGTLTFTGQPTANQTVTIGGTVVTFVASGATGPQVNIGASATATVAALLAFLQGSTDANISKATYAASGTLAITVTYGLSGQVGNAFTLATTVTGATVSGATLSGGLNGAPHPAWLWATGFCARTFPWLSDTTTGNVSRNQTGLVVQGLRPPRDRTLWPNYASRNTLVNSGVSTYKVGADGSVQIDKIVTTYRTGTAGQPDTVFRDVQALYQVSGALKYFRAQVGVEQANKAIASSNPGNLGAITTPADIKASFINAYGVMVAQGVLQDLATFAQTIVVQPNAQNPDRVDVFAPMERVNPLDILAVNATIYQQFPNPVPAAA